MSSRNEIFHRAAVGLAIGTALATGAAGAYLISHGDGAAERLAGVGLAGTTEGALFGTVIYQSRERKTGSQVRVEFDSKDKPKK